MTIARMWQALADGPEAAERYRQVFATEVAADLGALPGFRGAYLLARSDGTATALRTLTLFDSLDAVRAFAGPEYERERVTPAARATLRSSEPLIQHWNVLTEL